MAQSNRDRIGQMFDALSPALDEFITSVLAPDLTAETNWTHLVTLRDEKNGISGKEYSTTDPQLQLRMLTENIPNQVKPGWRPFNKHLSQVARSYASELRDTRNDWAHGESFSDDDAYRALDTAERLLKAIGKGAAATEVAGIRTNLRRVTAAKEDKRTLKSAVDSPESAGLKPWRDVLPPHQDVATGNFHAAEFAADLHKVASGTDTKDYSDPAEFFARTYLTEGLQDLIGRAVRRLRGDDNASPVINLQTNFGGGKTHSMLSLWHLAAGLPIGSFPQETQDLLVDHGYDKIPSTVRRVAIAGHHFAPTGETHDGHTVNTIWGELAWQLGGAEGYAMVADADRAGTSPGGALNDLLARYAPAVILIDEWVAYARQLPDELDASTADHRVVGGTFDTQFTFAQQLTEAAKATSGVLLAISIPASETGKDGNEPVAGNAEEVGGARGLEALKRLQNVVRRVADQWQPATSEEAYHIVRQRLFTTPDATALASIGATAKDFVAMYRKHSTDFPRETWDTDYEDRIKRTYPIHPELFDRLYEDWSSLERFQRTRGVLRLMNAVIHALWEGEDQGPLIMPGSIPLGVPAVNSELTQYLQDSWKAIISADVDGTNSEPAKIDREKPTFGQRSLTKRLARTVFFGAAPTIGSAHKGIETQRVFLGTATPGDVPGNFHSALNQLSDRATYFYSGSGKLWYDTQANISRRAKDQADRLHREDVWAEIRGRLESQARTRGDFAGVHVCPEENGDIPDSQEARLVILHPRYPHKKGAESEAVAFAHKATQHRGTSNRTYRNMLVFLAPDEARLAELDAAVRTYLGWSDVLGNADDLDLSPNQVRQATEKRTSADDTVEQRLLGTFQWALVPEQPDAAAPFTIAATKVEGQASSLAERVSKRLGNDGQLSVQQAAQTIRMRLNQVPKIWEAGHVSLGALWQLYATYPYLPRLKDRSVLAAGVANQPPFIWQNDGFALAEGYDEAGQRYAGLWLPDDNAQPPVTRDSLLLVRPDRATAQREAEAVSPTPPGPDVQPTPPGPDVPGPTPPAPDDPVPAPALKTRFFGSRTLGTGREAADFKLIFDEILPHLRTGNLTVRVEIEADSLNGYPEAAVRTVSENAATLKFDQHGFED